MINFDAFRTADVRREPYPMIVARGVVSPDAAAAVRADYPAISVPGYHPLSDLKVRGAFAELAADLESAELGERLSEALDFDLTIYPRLITVRRTSQPSDGRIHTDSPSKLMTMLLYLNGEWDGGHAGCLRALNGPDNFDDYVLEVEPLAGSVFGFLRGENSWHGHLPFTGERYVVQLTFLESEAAVRRKQRRGGFQMRLKTLLSGR